MSDLESLRGNLDAVRERIARAAERAGRRVQDVLLIGVSKTVTADRIRLGVEAGLTALGENRVQEARDKIKILGRPVPWHLDRKSTRLNSSHSRASRMPSSA